MYIHIMGDTKSVIVAKCLTLRRFIISFLDYSLCPIMTEFLATILGVAGTCKPQRLKHSKCDGQTCLNLYQAKNTDSLTWDQSYKMCRDLDQEMLRIETSHRQADVVNLLRGSNGKSPYQIWLAGQQSDQDTWKYMNGTIFKRQG